MKAIKAIKTIAPIVVLAGLLSAPMDEGCQSFALTRQAQATPASTSAP